MTINILILTPHTRERPQKLEEVADLAKLYGDLVNFSQANIEAGPVSIEGSFDEAICAPGVVAACLKAEKEGIHAVMIDCMGDPGLDAAREAVSIPVLGPGQTTMQVAAMLGHKFSVVTVLDRVRPLLEDHAKKYGISSKLASVRSVNIPVLSISEDETALLNALTSQSLAAITEDHADAIVLGCTGFLGVSEKLAEALKEAQVRNEEQKLSERNYAVPVLNPIQTTVSVAIALVGLGLSHSATAYPRADFGKAIVGYEFMTSKL